MNELSSSHDHHGLPIVISAPSGGGKSTIADKVLKEIASLIRSISCTTRKPRPGEKEGQDYYFLTEDEFKTRIQNNKFIEWAQVHNNYYGTPIDEFKAQLEKGRDVILTIDPQGAKSIRKIFPDGIFIFLVPPTWDDLATRLKKRASDSESTLKVRLQNAREEIKTIPQYDYLVVNDSLDVAVSDVVSIIRSEHRRVSRVNKRDIPIFSEVESA